MSWQSHNNIYLGARALRALPSAYNLSYLWNEYNHQELLFYGSTATDQRSTTLWRLGNAFLRQGYELHHRHAALVEQLGDLSMSDQFRCAMPPIVEAGSQVQRRRQRTSPAVVASQ